MDSGEGEREGAGSGVPEPEASVRHRPRRPTGHPGVHGLGGGHSGFEEWLGPDDEPEAGESDRSLLGAVGQLAAAVLAVAAIVALFIAAAIAFGWVFP